MSTEKEYKSVTVEKLIPVNYDLGNLVIFDSNSLEINKLSINNINREEYIKSITRDNTQLLINQILSLPIKSTTNGDEIFGKSSNLTLIKLPQPITELPREKPLPKTKEPTKWELFASKKGIKVKEKSSKYIYDENSSEWIPKWGFKGKNKSLDNQWLIEINDKDINKDNKNELINPRSLKRNERKKLIKKNELQKKRNLKKQ